MTITADTIITAELLAGLTACPFCEANGFADYGPSKRFSCGTAIYTHAPVSEFQAPDCFNAEIRLLHARVQELDVFVLRFLDPEDLGYSIGAYDRDCARVALGRAPVESKEEL